METTFDTDTPLVRVEREEASIRAVDPSGTSVRVTTRGWESLDPRHEFPERVDRRVGGRTRELRFSPQYANVRSLDDDIDLGDSGRAAFESEAHGIAEGETLDLEPASYLFRAGSELYAFARFDGGATISRDESGVSLSFSQPTTVTLGFRTLLRIPRERVTVPRTPSGIATAITHMSVAHRTLSPDRSFGTMRSYPPLVEFGDEVEIPDGVRERTPQTGIELRLPDSFEAVFAGASLAYYLGADVVTEDREYPVLRAPEAGVDYTFDGEQGDTDQPDTERFDVAAGRLLRRVFGLDCLVRNGGPYASDLEELDALDGHDFDIEHWYDAPADERLARYLHDDLDDLEPTWPSWQHVVTVDPVTANARALPHLLDRMAWIRLPGGVSDVEFTSPLAAYGSLGERATAESTTGFDATLDSFEHRIDALTQERDRRRITVVCADDRRREEAERVASDRIAWSGERRPEVTVHTNATVADLQSALSDPVDVLHFVGDWSEGFVCTDGVLALEDLSVQPRVCIVDAPGAAAASDALVSAGAVTVAARHSNAPAGVGLTFLRAVVEAFSPAHALILSEADGIAARLSSRSAESHQRDPAQQAALSERYRVVGDGFDTFESLPTLVAGIDEIGDNAKGDAQFEVAAHAVLGAPGGIYSTDPETVLLVGNTDRTRAPSAGLRDILPQVPFPIVSGGDTYWPEENDRLLYPFV